MRRSDESKSPGVVQRPQVSRVSEFLPPEAPPAVSERLRTLNNAAAPAVPAAGATPAARIDETGACGITWAQAAEKVEISAKLEQLPAGMAFGEDFPEPIQYDAQRKLLVYRGFMTTLSYNYLRKLSRDLGYIAAIDEVNIKSTMAVYEQPAPRRGWLWGLGGLALAAAAIVLFFVLRHGH